MTPRRARLHALLASAALAAASGLWAPAQAQQTITLDTARTVSVYGNGDATDYGALPGGGTGALLSPVGNSVIITATGSTSAQVYGAWGDTAEVSNNTVTVNGGTVTGNYIYGGYTISTGKVSGNQVIINSGTAGNFVFGGYSGSGEVVGNTVTINGGTVKIDVHAGESLNGNVSYNRLIMTGGEVKGMADGAYSNYGVLDHNEVIISGGTVGMNVFAAYSGVSGGATNNSVTISGGTIGGDVTAGRADDDGDVIDNTVTISGDAVISGSVYGGRAAGSTSTHTSGVATGNKVIIEGGTLKRSVVAGFSYQNTASGNTLIISGGTVAVTGYGAYTYYGSVTGNSVEVSGTAVVNNVYGAATDGGDGDATDNHVTMSGGTVKGGVYGGRAGFDSTYPATGDASNNSVEISGGTVGMNVYGGWAFDGDATNNTVTLSGTPTLSGSVYGGFVGQNAHDFKTGNTLNVKGTNGITVGGDIGNFQNLNFELPEGFSTASAPLLTVAGTADVDGATVGVLDKDGAVIPPGSGSAAQLPYKPEAEGEQMGTLLKAGTLTGTIANDGQIVNGSYSLTNYEFQVEQKPDSIVLAFTGKKHVDENKGGSIVENPIHKVTTVNFTHDHILERFDMWKYLDVGRPEPRGILPGRTCTSASGRLRHDGKTDDNRRQAICWGMARSGFSAIASVSGGTLSFGGKDDVKGNRVAFMAGGIYETPTAAGDLTAAVYAEGGSGSYDAKYSFGKVSGDTRHYGVGAFLRHTFTNGFYVDGSLRGGRILTNLSATGDIGFDGKSGYFGGHVGAGYEYRLTETTTVDVYARALFTRQGADSVVTDAGERVKFSAANSIRSRVGGRLIYKPREHFRMYIGGAWEHEFGGDMHIVVDDTRIKGRNRLRGNTGIIGVGAEWAAGDRLTLRAEIRGEFGRRRGVSGMLSATYRF
ncbi:MAG: autotransporter domain-containing protein [Methylobacteriaceae bacterium]|jgi:hypothetical protein|nr:autotransporter domain-containing protein [Methylobacteriaceae bacterium]